MWFRLLIIAGLAIALAQIPQLSAAGLSALPLAIVLGLLYGNVSGAGDAPEAGRAIHFCQKHALRLGIILFGFNLSFQQVADLGWQVVVTDVLVIVAVLTLGIVVGTRLLGMSRELAVLTSVGSAVCGAAAIMAADSVTRAREQEVAVAVASVVLFGTLAMFSYPIIYGISEPDQSIFGVYIGSTVHEVAQAVAAGESIGEEAMRSALVAKLVRVILLAPVVVSLGAILFRDRGTREGAPTLPVPWFVFGFVLVAGFNSLVALPATVLNLLQLASQLLLALGMAALGIKTHWRSIRKAGAAPILLSLLLFVLLLGGGFVLNGIFYQ